MARAFAVLVGVVAALGMVSNVSATTEATIKLVSSEPANGAVLSAAPTQILLQFDQAIPIDAQETMSVNCAGQLVGLDTAKFENERQQLVYPIVNAIGNGTCVGNWRLDAADGSPLASGNLSFMVGATTQTSAGATTTTTVAGADPASASTTAAPASDSGAGAASARAPSSGFSLGTWVGRFFSDFGILVLFGALVVIGTGWPEGPEYQVTSQFLRLIWIISLIGTFIYVTTYAGQVRGGSISAGLSPAAWLDLAQDGWPGIAAVLRMVLVIASAYVALTPERLDDPNSGVWAWSIPALAVVTLALGRVTGPLLPVGVVLGIFHVFATAVWLGGVVFVGRVVLAGPGEEDLVVATRTYSRTSVLAIVVTVVTGVLQAIRLDGGNFFSTHGLVLIAKIAAVAVMLFIGLEARKQVRFRLDREYEMSPGNAARFHRAYGTETAFGVIALALSSALMSLSPGTQTPWAGETYTRQIEFIDSTTGIQAIVKVGPSKVGLNGYLIEVTEPPSGITELKLRFIPPDGTQNGQAWIVEESIPLTGPGVAWRPTSVGVPLGVPGTWRLEMIATTSLGVQPGTSGVFEVLAADGTEATGAPAATNAPANVTVVERTTTPATVATTSSTTTTTLAPAG